ncbi:MAG: hypothetical protein HZA07_00260, partial [Nitrospirae bacterium]|nr:hypothetical protein [Nitrospirota bacterium]
PVAVTKVLKIKMSNAIRKRIELAHKGIKEFRKGGSNLFDVFLISKEAAMDILIIKGKLGLFRDYERFKKVWRKGLLSSEEIISITEVKTGPKLGRIIVELKKAQFEGRVRSKRSAIEFMRALNF